MDRKTKTHDTFKRLFFEFPIIVLKPFKNMKNNFKQNYKNKLLNLQHSLLTESLNNQNTTQNCFSKLIYY